MGFAGESLTLLMLSPIALYSIYIESVLTYRISNIYAGLLSPVMPDFRLQLLTSPLAPFGVTMPLCPVWRWLLCTVRNSFRNSWLPILASVIFKLSLFFYCRANAGKVVTAWKWLTETVYTLYVGFCRYNPFAPHSTLVESIKKFSVLLSLIFTCLGKNKLTSYIVYIVAVLMRLRWHFNLFTAVKSHYWLFVTCHTRHG